MILYLLIIIIFQYHKFNIIINIKKIQLLNHLSKIYDHFIDFIYKQINKSFYFLINPIFHNFIF